MEAIHISKTRKLVLFSGGQDSTTCLYNTLGKGFQVTALTINYGQRHAIELESANKIASMARELYGESMVDHIVLNVPRVLMGTSPLIDRGTSVPSHDPKGLIPEGIESTFVPGRNLFFFSIAANVAVAKGCRSIVSGVSQEDYGGYPDCREEFITAMNVAIGHALAESVEAIPIIETPLIHMSKADTVILASELNGCMDALAYSHTCYEGRYPPGPTNHASILRARGFRDARIPDPLIVRAKQEGLLPDNHSDYGVC